MDDSTMGLMDSDRFTAWIDSWQDAWDALTSPEPSRGGMAWTTDELYADELRGTCSVLAELR